jgi:hypothetical protein
MQSVSLLSDCNQTGIGQHISIIFPSIKLKKYPFDDFSCCFVCTDGWVHTLILVGTPQVCKGALNVCMYFIILFTTSVVWWPKFLAMDLEDLGATRFSER